MGPSQLVGISLSVGPDLSKTFDVDSTRPSSLTLFQLCPVPGPNEAFRPTFLSAPVHIASRTRRRGSATMCLLFLHQGSELVLYHVSRLLFPQARWFRYKLLAKRGCAPGLVHCVFHVVLPTVSYLVSFSVASAPLPCRQGAVAPIFVCTLPSTGDASEVAPFFQHLASTSLDVGSQFITLTYFWS